MRDEAAADLAGPWARIIPQGTLTYASIRKCRVISTACLGQNCPEISFDKSSFGFPRRSFHELGVRNLPLFVSKHVEERVALLGTILVVSIFYMMKNPQVHVRQTKQITPSPRLLQTNSASTQAKMRSGPPPSQPETS